MLAAAAVLAVGASYYGMRAARPAVAEVRSGTVEVALGVDAVIVRKEKVYTAPIAGRLRRLTEEGQRVRVGAPVAQVVPGPASTAAGQPVQPPPVAQPAPRQAAPPQQAGQSPIRRQIDDLHAEIYQVALAWNKARDNGDAVEMERLQGLMDDLAARQSALAQQVGREEAPVPAPPPALPAAPVPVPAPAEKPVAGGTDVTVDTAGIMVYQTDGLEALLTPGQTESWTPSWFRTLAGEPRKPGDEVAAGEPIFKVVDNLGLNVLAVVPASLLQSHSSDRVTLRFEGLESPPVVTRIASRHAQGDEVLLVLTAPVFPAELTWNRRVKATLVFGSYSGLVVPRSSIDVRDGRQGVWVVDGSRESFRPVRVLGGNAQEVALEADLVPGLTVRLEAPAHMR
jgi:putative membrane fusion protein